MINNKPIEKLTRCLIVLIGIGLGIGVAALAIALVKRYTQQLPIPEPFFSGAVYVALVLLSGIVFTLLSYTIYVKIMKLFASITKRFDAMPTQQIIMITGGVILGFVVASLISQLILSVGTSLATVSFSALTYILLGYLGRQIGNRSYQNGHSFHIRYHKRNRKSAADSTADETSIDFIEEEQDTEETVAAEEPVGVISSKVLDSSVFFDGRILNVYKTGFLEGKLIIPRFVLTEMQHVADNADPQRRNKGRRGLDAAAELQKLCEANAVVSDVDYPEIAEVDTKLLQLCKDTGSSLVTNDYNLIKVSKLYGMHVLNMNDLAIALKPALQNGDELTVHIAKEGREPGQGVAYLDDGTMIVVENGRSMIDKNAAIVITSILQTSAGRMIFGRIREAG